MTFITRSAFSLPRESTMVQSTSVAATQISMRLMLAVVRQKWVFNNKGSWVIGSPAVEDGKVYFATSDSGLFYELDGNSGQPVFSLGLPSIGRCSRHPQQHARQHLIYWLSQRASDRNKSDLQESELDFPNGWLAPERRHIHEARLDPPNYEAAFSEDFFYDNLVAGMLKMMSVGAILSSPVIVDGVIYAGSTDGYLYALM